MGRPLLPPSLPGKAYGDLERRLMVKERHPSGGPWITVGTEGVDGVDALLAANPHPYATGDTPGPPPFQNDWTNALGGVQVLQFAYITEGGFELRGGIVGGTPPSIVFTLPSADPHGWNFTPDADEFLLWPSNEGDTVFTGLIDSGGNVSVIDQLVPSGGAGPGTVITITSGDGFSNIIDPGGPTVTIDILNSPEWHGVAVVGTAPGVSGLVPISNGDGTATWGTVEGSGTIDLITSDDDSLTVTDGSGPSTDLSVQNSPAWGGVTIEGSATEGYVPVANAGGTTATWESAVLNITSDDLSVGITITPYGQYDLSVASGSVASVFGRTGVVVAVDGDYYGIVAAELTGADTGVARWVGTTSSGAPVTGTFDTGDMITTEDAHIFICTAGGTPGTWVDIASGGGLPPWIQYGTGTPYGTVLPYAEGAFYFDNAYGGLFTADNTALDGWVQIGGTSTDGIVYVYIQGVGANQTTGLTTVLGGGEGVWIGDVPGINGTGNRLQWQLNGADGDQALQVQTGSSGQYTSTLQAADGNMYLSGIVNERGVATSAITAGALFDISFVSGVGQQIFIGATVLAAGPPTLPLTITRGVNAGITPGVASLSFFVADGTYTTVDDLVTAINASTSSQGVVFSTQFLATNDAGSILITALAPGSDGTPLAEGPAFATGSSPITAPVTVTLGVNDAFCFENSAFVLAPGTYSTATALVTAVNAAIQNGPSVFDSDALAYDEAGTMVIDGAGTGYIGVLLNSGPPYVTATTAPPTVPLTVVTGVNDTFIVTGTPTETVTVAAGTYTTVDDIVAALNLATYGAFGPIDTQFGRAVNISGSVRLIAGGAFSIYGGYTVNTGPTDVLAALGFTNGQGFAGSADILADMGFTDGTTMAGNDDLTLSAGFSGESFSGGIEPARDFQVSVPVTYNPSGGDAVCLIELSPDNTTYTALDGTGEVIKQQFGEMWNETPSGTINGVNDVFTLVAAPTPPSSLMLFKNGILQGAGAVDYTLSGSTITFEAGSTPLTSDTLLASYGTAGIDGIVRTVPLYVPVGWYVRYTVTNATLGGGTFY